MTLVRKGRKEGDSGDKWSYPKELKSNEQLKEEVEVVVNNIDFRCVQMEVTFEVQGVKHEQLLILNLSKVKLFRWMPYTAPPRNTQKIERVFEP